MYNLSSKISRPFLLRETPPCQWEGSVGHSPQEYRRGPQRGGRPAVDGQPGPTTATDSLKDPAHLLGGEARKRWAVLLVSCQSICRSRGGNITRAPWPLAGKRWPAARCARHGYGAANGSLLTPEAGRCLAAVAYPASHERGNPAHAPTAREGDQVDI